MNILASTVVDSPVGPITIGANDEGVCLVTFDPMELAPPHDAHPKAQQHARVAATQLREYFAGARTKFDLPLVMKAPSFTRRVWKALAAIPYGKTVAYKDIAHILGKPTAMRAVGQANNRNRIAVIIPCHRVVAADGSLHGYAAGLECKKWLLDHERTVAASQKSHSLAS